MSEEVGDTGDFTAELVLDIDDWSSELAAKVKFILHPKFLNWKSSAAMLGRDV